MCVDFALSVRSSNAAKRLHLAEQLAVAGSIIDSEHGELIGFALLMAVALLPVSVGPGAPLPRSTMLQVNQNAMNATLDDMNITSNTMTDIYDYISR
jgi:hypothetical protein